MNQTPDVPPSDVSRPSKPRLAIVLAACALGAGYLYFSRSDQRTLFRQNAELIKEVENLKEALQEKKTAELYRAEEQNVKKDELLKASQQVKRIAGLLETLREKAAAWATSTQALLDGDEGKRIAMSKQAADQFHAVYTAAQPAPELPDELKVRLSPLAGQIQQALDTPDSVYSPQQNLLQKLDEIEKQATDAITRYGAASAQLKAILDLAPQSPPRNTPTLRTAFQRRENELAASDAEVVKAALEKTRTETAKEIADMKADYDRRLQLSQAELEKAQKELETARLAADARSARDQAAEEKKAREREAARAELERRFQAALPDIKKYLVACTESGYAQPDRFGSMMTRTDKKGPVSYSKLMASRGMGPGVEGLKDLQRLLGRQENDRSKGALAPYVGGERHWTIQVQEGYQKAKDLLNEFGDLMVEKGMLAP